MVVAAAGLLLQQALRPAVLLPSCRYFKFYNIGLYDFSSVRNCSALIKLD